MLEFCGRKRWEQAASDQQAGVHSEVSVGGAHQGLCPLSAAQCSIFSALKTAISPAGQRHHQEAAGGSEGSAGQDQGEKQRHCFSREDPAGDQRQTAETAERAAGHTAETHTEGGGGAAHTHSHGHKNTTGWGWFFVMASFGFFCF